MYMNVNAILAAQRPGAGLAGPPGGPPGPAPAASAGRAGCGCRGSQSLAGKGFQAARPGPGLRVRVGRPLRLRACPAGSCLTGTAGAGLGAHALVARSRHESVHSAQISPHLRSLADVVSAGSAARLRSAWLT